jgi:hypothetical protein
MAGERRRRERARLGTGEAGDTRWDAGASRGKQRRHGGTRATKEQGERATECARACAGSACVVEQQRGKARLMAAQ